MHDKHFHLKKIKLKTKDLKSPWITTGIKKVLKTEATALYKILAKQKPKTRDRILEL